MKWQLCLKDIKDGLFQVDAQSEGGIHTIKVNGSMASDSNAVATFDCYAKQYKNGYLVIPAVDIVCHIESYIKMRRIFTNYKENFVVTIRNYSGETADKLLVEVQNGEVVDIDVVQSTNQYAQFRVWNFESNEIMDSAHAISGYYFEREENQQFKFIPSSLIVSYTSAQLLVVEMPDNVARSLTIPGVSNMHYDWE